MKKIILFAILISFSPVCFSQEPETSEVKIIDQPIEEEPLLFAEQMAEFPGGEGVMQAFIIKKTISCEEAEDKPDQ